MSVGRSRGLTHASVASRVKPGRMGDGRRGHGLFLRISQSADGGVRKSWCQRIKVNGKWNTVGLGPFPLVSLAEARDKAFENARLNRHGELVITPRTQRAGEQSKSASTLDDAFREVIEIRQPNWTSAKTLYHWNHTRRFFQPISSMPIADIRPRHVLDLISPIWSTKNSSVKSHLRHVTAVMGWAFTEGLIDANLFARDIHRNLPKIQSTKHLPALYPEDLGKAMILIRDSDAWWAIRLCLLFTFFTVVRNGEARGATWDEIDWDSNTWTIPARRMKSREDHIVYLSTSAVAILEMARLLCRPSSPYIFNAVRKDVQLRGDRLSELMNELSIPAVPHGVRSSFSTWSDDYERHFTTTERTLAHKLPSIQQTYRDIDPDHDPEIRTTRERDRDKSRARAQIIQDWDDYICTTLGSPLPAKLPNNDPKTYKKRPHIDDE